MSKGKDRKGPGKAARSVRQDANYGMLSELIGYHLRRAQAVVFDDFMRAMAQVRITPGQFGVLTMIEANPGISQSALARALGIERSTMVGVLNELEARQLAERRVSQHDRRSYTLALTCDGSALLKTLKSKVRRHEKRIGSDLDSAQRTALIGLLRRIYESP